MHKELHLFIIWSKGLYLQEPIIEDIKKHFEIKQIFNCKWEKQSFASRLSRFYGKKLFQCCKKEKHCVLYQFYHFIDHYCRLPLYLDYAKDA